MRPGSDHTPVAPGEDLIFGEQLGPGRASRAIAIVHIAIFDAVNAIDNAWSYTGIATRPAGASVNAAIAQAAHDTLARCFHRRGALRRASTRDLELISDRRDKTQGWVGRRAAPAILALRR